MAVSRSAITARSRTFWDVAHYLVDHDHGGPAARGAGCPNNADATWGFEKCWPIVFDSGRTPSNPLEDAPIAAAANDDDDDRLKDALARAARLQVETDRLKKTLYDAQLKAKRADVAKSQAALENMVIRPPGYANAAPE